MFRKLLFLILGVGLLLSGCSEVSNEKEIRFEGGLIINRGEDFKLGEMENLKFNEKTEIILDDNITEGRYLSPIINTSEFKELVSSWNIDTPNGTEIELSIKVKVEDEWSMWLSYGKWSSSDRRGSIKGQKDTIANMSIDTLETLDDKNAKAFQYNIILTRENSDVESPRIRSIFTTLKLSDETIPVLGENKDWLIELNVPERSQMIVPEIGSVICSPTSLSMVMEYYGNNLKTEEVADKVLDGTGNIYGNWSYNVAFAGSQGFTSYVARFASINEIKDKIANGIPVIASIKTKSEGILKEAPQAYPSGHLLVVRGFTIKDGKEYVIVNDPAAPDNSTVRREYEVAGFEKAWSKIVYILIPEV